VLTGWSMRCLKCWTNNPSTNNFCAKCGSALAKHCAKCEADNPPTSDFCGKCGASLGEPVAPQSAPTELASAAPGPATDGERRHLTVLFCDLVGSTPLSQRLDAEEWREVLAKYQQAASDVVARFGGYVAKNLGDGLLIYFGWPTAREDDPARAIRAGLAIADAMAPLNATLAADDGTRLEVRIGIHTGPVVIADGGEVFGDTANIAARVQTAAEPDTVVITAATQRLVAGLFVVNNLGPQTLKGVLDPVTLYHVVQPSGVRGRLDIAAGRLTRFVGREPELATVIDHWERAQDGEGQNVLIIGEAGVGKSRLASQLREHLAGTPHTWLECGATPYTESTPFHPVIELVRQGLAFAPEDTLRDKLAKIEAALTLANIVSPEAMMIMADFLNLERAENRPQLAMSPEMQRRKTMELLAAWELALAEAQPLVVVVEDLHWSDPSSLELLGRLIAQSATARVMLIGTARPEFVAPWPERSNLTAIKLARLTKRQARSVIERVAIAMEGADASEDGDGARPAALSEAIIDAIVARADGIPLFLEELARTALEPGVAGRVDEIPATLADSLMARLDRLSAAKEVAQRASVLGREFSYPLLSAVVGLEEASLRQGLARLDEAEILFVRGEPPTAIYTFKHALVQEAAYESLLKRTRRQLHRRVVEVMLAQFPERAAAEPEVMARHAELAGRIDEAITYCQRAGEQAQARSAHGEAIAQFRKAIALLAMQPEGAQRDTHEVALQLSLGGSLSAVRGFAHPEVEAAYERARVLCEAVGDAGRLGRALLGLAAFYMGCGEVERGRTLAARLLAAAEQSGDTEMALLANANVAAAEYYQGKFASSLAHCEAVRTLYEPGRHHVLASISPGDPGADALATAAWALWALGWPDRALGRAREAVRLARQLCHSVSLAEALGYETAVHWLRRDVTEQRERAAEAIALTEAQGFPLWLGMGRMFHALARATSGEPAAVADMLTAVALLAETDNQSAAPALFVMFGEAYLAAGQHAEARGAVETGLAIAAQTGQFFFDSELNRLRGEIVLASGGALAEAEGHFHDARDIARGQEAKSFELRAATSLARLWRNQGKRAEARDLLAPLYGWFTEGFDTADLKDAKALLDEISE
jgi:class 3 adenylate cyclase/predicted ATPase/ribosomal protein L40E